MTWRLTVARADAHGRLRVGRLGLALEPADDTAGRALWPLRWNHDLIVLGPDRHPTEVPTAPAVLTPQARLQLPADLCAHLDTARQPVLVACDGRELWLVKTSFVAAELLEQRRGRSSGT
ncbi:hypothetical protein SAMN05660209_03288 [Geodermatophilus africanus]|uniref:Uncharacterized protein n=1 Tax=Geodermatophilus africanus TaxID=1137993 RepID=A0A1H3LDA7_9ACTN|nr:hypothetical protein [Geodermatophilus africanus]SDY62149.1 hypothetical protein SAMN05660209_03288 [Geodermatophilus africanus]